ncbi:DNA internalization-related competence protein ComEC/Rec2 [Pseudomonas sp. gcc21]|uniref:DNA internalization-related competence protein ComEC/Rec2 n=1 Tax=Pseudomonas sp. gcc21 TaxID=2726989 RepID=UPI001451D8EB|nr:DNA internalization-related competence protein ComEC/Rec2 [Pseudomonas sp. gcc21]QJD58496.1 DNA internalization-related competence protein ComEC/Rec2 [Pseudomonas sp. gcc21]
MALSAALFALFVGLITPLLMPSLPPAWSLAVVLPVMLGAALFGRSGRVFAAFLAGLIWASYCHHQMLDKRLVPALDGQKVLIEGRISGLPEPTLTGWRFELAEARMADTGEALPLIRAHWYAGEPVASNQRWRFEANLRRPRGMSNPGGFDYEAWLYAQEIGALASIRHGQLLEEPVVRLSGLRSYIRQRLDATLVPQPGGQRLLALIVGDRSVLSADEWTIMQATGTSHLMVISGLHVGMLASLAFLIMAVCARLRLFPGRWPRFWFAAPLAVLLASGYAALAGFAVPTQRALLMILLVLIARLIYRQPGPWVTWLAALCAVVMVSPAAPLKAGFWLSFMAVGLLIFGMSGRLAVRGIWLRWGKAQWVIFVGLWPWLLLWAMPVSLSAPLVNAVAIPWVSLVVVPAALLGAVFDVAFGWSWLLLAAAHALDALFDGLAWFADFQAPLRMAFPGWLGWSVGATGTLALLSPLSRLLLVPALVSLAVLLLPGRPVPQQGAFWVTVLDVGQGSSALIQTSNHTLLYDTGARLSSGFDLGEAVVHPALVSFGLRKLDVMLLSHADNDHAGGALAIQRLMQVDRVLSGEHERQAVALNAEQCRAGDSWDWDGVHFKIMYAAGAPANSNDRSCVLKVTTGDSSLLLTGDLGMSGEYELLAEDVQADLLLAPHHGSRSSSSYAFIRAVAPRWVVFSAGYGNRFGHPHKNVVQRYRELGAEPVYTATSGAVRFVLNGTGQSMQLWSWREHSRRFWHE